MGNSGMSLKQLLLFRGTNMLKTAAKNVSISVLLVILRAVVDVNVMNMMKCATFIL